ncbi:MAG: hypothetical protein WC867_08525 [Candidatus Pacearchaeota archaeon]|jgi:hypothetical protein
MKKGARELNLKDLKLQIVLGIVLVILVLIIGFISINSTINNTCSNGNLGGELNLVRSVGSGSVSMDLGCSGKTFLASCKDEANRNGICCYIQADSKNPLFCYAEDLGRCPDPSK